MSEYPRNRAQNVTGWRDDELWLILLRQFKRLLLDQGVELTDAQMHTIAQRAARREAPDAQIEAIRAALHTLIAESLAVLRGWNLSYAESLATPMEALPGWETTAEFLQLANEKGNAELRISAGAALLAGLGDAAYAGVLLATYRYGLADPEDVDAVIARRALAFVSGIPPEHADWHEQVAAWVAGL